MLVLFLLGGTVNGFAQNAQSEFQKANEAYSDQNYDEAIELYKRALNQGESAKVYYNLGNAYFKQQKIAQAILNYERALRLEPGGEDIKHNLEVARSYTADEIEELPQTQVTQWWNSVVKKIGPNTWAWITVLLVFLGCAFLALYFLGNSSFQKKTGFFTGIVLIALAILSWQFSVTTLKSAQSDDFAIITTPKVNVLSAPDKEAGTVFVLHEGTKIELRQEDEQWYEIRIANGNVGWIRTEDCEVI